MNCVIMFVQRITNKCVNKKKDSRLRVRTCTNLTQLGGKRKGEQHSFRLQYRNDVIKSGRQQLNELLHMKIALLLRLYA